MHQRLSPTWLEPSVADDPGVIFMAQDSPLQNLKDLFDTIKADPGSVAFEGGLAVGGFVHMKPLHVMKAAGFDEITKIIYIGLDGGADAITLTVGGFAQAMTGNARPLAVPTKGRAFRALTMSPPPEYKALTKSRITGAGCTDQRASLTISSMHGRQSSNRWPRAISGST